MPKPLKTITVSRDDKFEMICADCAAHIGTDYGAQVVARDIIHYHLITYHPDATGAQYWTRETVTPESTDTVQSGE